MRTIEDIKADMKYAESHVNDWCNGDRAMQDENLVEYYALKAELFDAITESIPLDRLTEICDAEREGRCVVLPNIPHNKTLYWLWGDEIMPVRYKGISGGCIGDDKKYHVTCKMSTKKDREFIHGKNTYTYKTGDLRRFYFDDFGKTVFLTREAAEQALKERENDDHS